MRHISSILVCAAAFMTQTVALPWPPSNYHYEPHDTESPSSWYNPYTSSSPDPLYNPSPDTSYAPSSSRFSYIPISPSSSSPYATASPYHPSSPYHHSSPRPSSSCSSWSNESNCTMPAVTEGNTLNTTVSPPPPSASVTSTLPAGGQFSIAIINNFPGNGQFYAYLSGLDVNNRLVMLQPNGQFYYPSTNSSVPTPIDDSATIALGTQGSTTTVNLPGWISGARLWVSEGILHFFVVQSQGTWSLVEPSVVAYNDPNINTKYGFVELTNDANLGLFINLSFVDFVGLALGVAVQSGGQVGAGNTKSTTSTQTVSGLSQASASQICSDLQAQASIDGQPWDNMCVADSTTGEILRVLSPAEYISTTPSAFSNYWTAYINQVWTTYSAQPLYINTQTSAGNISCTITGDQLNCGGDNRPYSRPTAADIFGCSTGPFSLLSTDNDIHRAVVPRLCAAINRSTLLLPGGNYQPNLPHSMYNTVSPTNFYNKLVHQYEAAGIGYAFSYDDVAPSVAEDQSGLIWSTHPTQLVVTING